MNQAQWIWEAYIDLSNTRPWGPHGPDPMSLADMNAWAEMKVVDVWDRSFLSRVLIKLDGIFLTHTYAELKKEREAAQKKSQSSQPRRGR